ncbi:hypothetical protein AWB78_07237 [Caballeronia calidae]|uniref:Uncharacterized protein n=1 Tax=Caballeronia calidae TaxID=1777139 RepID=A0A158EDS3_9BURK|nr:hypothetical protein [Caballeronia calidae]SAL04998.1 hypothetical protein AWB78_07237 [Caballeronia calidae]
MNSSVSFMQSEQVVKARSRYCDSGLEGDTNPTVDGRYLHRPAGCTKPSQDTAPCAFADACRTFTVDESPSDRRPPLPPQTVARSVHEPQVIRFVDGQDAFARRSALEACLRQHWSDPGRTLLISCRKGELPNQLQRAKIWVAERSARHPTKPVFVGIDGIDQWLLSPGVVASNLVALLNVGATVACSVDSRYGDSRLLMFHLRTLGIVVICQPVLSVRRVSVCAGRETPRLALDTEPEVSAWKMRKTPAPAPGAMVAERRSLGTHTRKNARSPRECEHHRTRDGMAGSTFSEHERIKYARAYRNAFAVNRLLREVFGA